MELLTDAFSLPQFSQQVLRLLREQAVLRSAGGELQFRAEAALLALEGIDENDFKLLSAEQSNSSALIGGQVLLKLLRRGFAGIHPEVEMGRFLTDHGYANVAPFLGEVVRVDEQGQPHTLMVMQRYLDNQGDAWQWTLNTLDRRGRGADGSYLTLTGTSAEDDDSGQVGRGNRVNGLISFARPAGSEAAPGKNPVAHPGKIYSVLSHRLAREIHARCPGLREVYVHLATRIGEPIDRPWAAVQLVLAEGVTLGDIGPRVRDVVDAELARMPLFRSELVLGQYPVC